MQKRLNKIPYTPRILYKIRPVFYIKYGPPASGKSSIMQQVLEKDRIQEHSLITVDVDAIMARSIGYTEGLKKLIAEQRHI
jgi:hypothetical protein